MSHPIQVGDSAQLKTSRNTLINRDAVIVAGNLRNILVGVVAYYIG